MSAYTEDTLVQQTTADYVEQHLGWRSEFVTNYATIAGNDAVIGPVDDFDRDRI